MDHVSASSYILMQSFGFIAIVPSDAGCTSPVKAPAGNAGPTQLGMPHFLVTQDVEANLHLPSAPPPIASGCITTAVNASGIPFGSLHGSMSIESELQVPSLPAVIEAALVATVPSSAEALTAVPNDRNEAHEVGMDTAAMGETLFEAGLDSRRGELIRDDSDPQQSTDLVSRADLGRGQRKRKPTTRLAAMDNGEEHSTKRRR